MDITLFKNLLNQYGALNHFREALTRAFHQLKIGTHLIDFEKSGAEFIQEIYRSPPDFTFALNGLRPFDNLKFLADELEIPHIVWLVDSAYYFSEMVKSPYNIIISPDETSNFYMKKWGAKYAHFIPHGFDPLLTKFPDRIKEYPVTFLGTFMDFLSMETTWKEIFPKKIVGELIAQADEVLKDSSLTIFQAFEQVTNQPFFHSFSEETKINLMTQFDYYIRAKHRIELIKALHRCPVHLFGTSSETRNWKDVLEIKNGHYIFHEGVDFLDSLTVIKKSQFVLNSSPMFKQGAHERIFYGLGLGSLVITNQTPWIDKHFNNQKDILTYSYESLPFLGEQIAHLCNHPEKIKEMAFNGQKKVLAEHTWLHRAQELKKHLETIQNS